MSETTIENIRSHPAFAELQKRYEWTAEAFPEHLSNGEPNPLHGITGLMVFLSDVREEITVQLGLCEKQMRTIENRKLVTPLIENCHGDVVKKVIAKYSNTNKLADIPLEKQEAFAADIKTLLSILL